MALKFQIDTLDGLPSDIREHYTKVGDKFQLATEGTHPKVEEFRETNVRLMAEIEPLKAKVKQFDGIDPATIAADRAKLAELDTVKASLATKESELATERAARSTAQKQADALVLETKISDVFLKSGGLPKARGVIVAAAASQFTVEGGVLKGKTFSPDRPGEPLSVEEFMTLQSRENSFCFGVSSGGGATGSKGGGATGGAKELRDPSPQQLGEHAAAIKDGKLKVVYTT